MFSFCYFEREGRSERQEREGERMESGWVRERER